MKKHNWLDKNNAIWLFLSAYHDLTAHNMSYDDSSQWNGKELKEISRYLLGVVTQSLQDGIPSQHPIFNLTIECTCALFEFDLYAQQKSHDDATFSYMEDAMQPFQTFKGVFLPGRAGK
jgi:hypothetical protein